MTPRFDISGEIGAGDATGAAVGRFCAANPGPVDIFINSPGGVATEGSAIFAALERHGQMTAVMAALGAMRDTTSNSTKTSRSILKAKRARARYYKLMGMAVPQDMQLRATWEGKIDKANAGGKRYFIPKEGDQLKQGIYAADSSGQLSKILALTTTVPTYTPRFMFEDVARAKAIAKLPGNFTKAMAHHLATAR